MWTMIAGFFSKTFGFDKILLWLMVAIIAIIVIPNYNQIRERLGFKTVASVEKQLVEVKKDNQILTDVANNNAEVIQKQEEIQKLKEETIVQNVEKQKTVENKIDQIAKPKKSITKPVVVERARDPHTEERAQQDIERLWAVYEYANSEGV